MIEIHYPPAAEIGAGEITGAMVKDGAITNDKVAAAAAIADSKINPVPSTALSTHVAAADPHTVYRLESTALVDADIAAAAAIAATKIAGTAATLAGTESLSGKTISDTLNMTTGAITQTGTAAHITMTPGASKLVRTAVLKQDNTTNTYKNNSVILTGWGFKVGSGSNPDSETITFGITFATVPILVANFAGRSDTATPDTLDDFSAGGQEGGNTTLVCSPSSISTTGATIWFGRSSGNFSATSYYAYTWIAIGELT